MPVILIIGEQGETKIVEVQDGQRLVCEGRTSRSELRVQTDGAWTVVRLIKGRVSCQPGRGVRIERKD